MTISKELLSGGRKLAVRLAHRESRPSIGPVQRTLHLVQMP